MANYNSFNKAKNFGNIGEAAVQQLLIDNGFEVLDTSENERYFDCGDILAVKPDGTNFFIEVKTDSAAAHTGNLVIELVTNKAYDKDGWFRTSKADKFAFYLIETNEVILIDAAELRENYISAMNAIKTTIQYECGYIEKEGVIALISIDKLTKLSSFRRIQLNGGIKQ